jgi:hypothetical protein
MKVLILAGSLYQTVPEAPIDSSQQQRFFHMTLEKWLQKNGAKLAADSDWRKNFGIPVKGQLLDPLAADNRRSRLTVIYWVLSALTCGFAILSGWLIKSQLLGIVCLTGLIVVIAALGFKTEELKPGSKNDLRWSLETAAKHLYERSDPSHGLRLVCECGFNWTREGADAKLKALGSPPMERGRAC